MRTNKLAVLMTALVSIGASGATRASAITELFLF
jgi:hypothetical protein